MKPQQPLLLSALTFFLATGAHADLHKCGDIWTNKACTTQPSSSLQETPHRERTKEEQERDQKERWLADLDAKSLKAKNDYGIDINIDDSRLFCFDARIALLDCRKNISDKEELIDKRVEAAKVLELKKKELAQAKQGSNEQNNLTIVQQTQENEKIIVGVPSHRLPPDQSHGREAPERSFPLSSPHPRETPIRTRPHAVGESIR